MKLEINGTTYETPPGFEDQLIDKLWERLQRLYETNIDDFLKTGLMALTRAMLVREEISVRAKYGKEAALVLRPPKKADPTLFLASLYLPKIREDLCHVTAHITLEEGDRTCTDLRITTKNLDQARGQLDSDGSARVGQNDGVGLP